MLQGPHEEKISYSKKMILMDYLMITTTGSVTLVA